MTSLRTIEGWARAQDAATFAAQCAVTAIAAPTGHEAARGAWMASQLAAAGVSDVRTDAVGNVSAILRGTTDAPPVVLCAHLDTVFETLEPIVVRQTPAGVAAPGIGDNGRGLAVLLAVARACTALAATPRRSIHFVATVGEEGLGDLRGAKHYFAHCGAAHAAVALDGTGDEQIVARAVGSRRFRAEIDGPGGHSWSDRGTANPVHAASLAISELVRQFGADARHTASSNPRDPSLASVDASLTVSRIGGGHAINAVPANAWFEVDIRATDTAVIASLEHALRSAVDRAVAESNAARRGASAPLAASIRVIGDRPAPAREPAAQEALVSLAEALTRNFGGQPSRIAASTDANVPLSLGIPAIAIGGGGSGGGMHTTGEWYANNDGWRGIARAIALTLALTDANRR